MPYANNKRADQPAQSDQRLCCSLPSQYNTSSFYIRNSKPLAVAEQPDASLTWSQTSKTGLLVTWLIWGLDGLMSEGLMEQYKQNGWIWEGFWI